MSTLPRKETPKSGTLFHSNPILSRLGKVTERTQTNTATYAGIASKTTYFLLMTLGGIVLQLFVMSLMKAQPVWQTIQIYKGFEVAITKPEVIIVGVTVLVGFISELIGIFVRRTVPVTGTIYAVSQGYVISFLVFKALKGYEYLGLEALLLTVAVVAVMSWLYKAGIIKANKKFHTILLSLVLGSIAFGVFSFLGNLIPFTRPYVQAMMQNAWLAIGLDVLGLVIASLFLISDFNVIDTCVQEGYPKEYEWYAAFGLVFTVLWIYLKILDLLVRLTGKNKN